VSKIERLETRREILAHAHCRAVTARRKLLEQRYVNLQWRMIVQCLLGSLRARATHRAAANETVEARRRVPSRAEILLAGHMQVFHRLVEDLEAHGELPGSYIDTMFAVEAAESSNRMRQVERRPVEPPMRWRETPWQLPVLAR
jgi:hypothetical protein